MAATIVAAIHLLYFLFKCVKLCGGEKLAKSDAETIAQHFNG